MQKEKPIISEVIMSVIVGKNVRMNIFLIMNGYRDTAVCI